MFKKTSLSTTIEVSVFSIAALICMLLYWNLYVKPADDFKYCVIACMQGDNSFESYTSCVESIKSGKTVCEQ